MTLLTCRCRRHLLITQQSYINHVHIIHKHSTHHTLTLHTSYTYGLLLAPHYWEGIGNLDIDLYSPNLVLYIFHTKFCQPTKKYEGAVDGLQLLLHFSAHWCLSLLLSFTVLGLFLVWSLAPIIGCLHLVKFLSCLCFSLFCSSTVSFSGFFIIVAYPSASVISCDCPFRLVHL